MIDVESMFFQTSVISWPLSHQNHVTDPHEADITPGESTCFSRKPYAAAAWEDQKFTLVPILVGGLMTEKARTPGRLWIYHQKMVGGDLVLLKID